MNLYLRVMTGSEPQENTDPDLDWKSILILLFTAMKPWSSSSAKGFKTTSSFTQVHGLCLIRIRPCRKSRIRILNYISPFYKTRYLQMARGFPLLRFTGFVLYSYQEDRVHGAYLKPEVSKTIFLPPGLQAILDPDQTLQYNRICNSIPSKRTRYKVPT